MNRSSGSVSLNYLWGKTGEKKKMNAKKYMCVYVDLSFVFPDVSPALAGQRGTRKLSVLVIIHILL